MKKIKILSFFLFIGCIGEDIEFDEVDPVVRLTNPITSLEINTMYQFEYMFLDNVGMEVEPSTIAWTSSDAAILTVDDMGLVQAISNGNVTLNISAMLDELEADTNITFEVTGDPTVVLEGDRSGTVQSTSSYILAGDFVLSEDGSNLLLSFDSNYEADTGLPGLFVYLSNNPNSTSGAFEIGAVMDFSGTHEYMISNVGLFKYEYVLYYCKPFNVKVGHGNIN